MLCLRILTRLGIRYGLRQVWSSVIGLRILITSTSGRPEMPNSSSWLLSVRVVTSLNPRPTMTSLRFSDSVVRGSNPPEV